MTTWTKKVTKADAAAAMGRRSNRSSSAVAAHAGQVKHIERMTQR